MSDCVSCCYVQSARQPFVSVWADYTSVGWGVYFILYDYLCLAVPTSGYLSIRPSIDSYALHTRGYEKTENFAYAEKKIDTLNKDREKETDSRKV
ncbi:unnamed protein product [Protopolystoma xenopodis]|uniref:Uncharacterized protein n=1 Tax=Protopolystoma xenopodis TaxID=117903 RepID=A0A3S5APX9_9PLAT|nr:unnamed protein product [Protopolystoma xenopodis]